MRFGLMLLALISLEARAMPDDAVPVIFSSPGFQDGAPTAEAGLPSYALKFAGYVSDGEDHGLLKCQTEAIAAGNEMLRDVPSGLEFQLIGWCLPTLDRTKLSLTFVLEPGSEAAVPLATGFAEAHPSFKVL